MMHKISVIIATKDRLQDLVQCLESVMAQTRLPYEIVIVDASAVDGAPPALDLFLNRGVRFEYIHTIPNLAAQRNKGIDHSSGDIVVFLDDDVILYPDCLAAVCDVFGNDRHGKLGGVANERVIEQCSQSRLKHFAFWGVLVPCYQAFATIFLLVRYGDGRWQISGHPTIIRPGTVDHPVKVEYAVGANMAFRRKALDEVRFDETLPYFDDHDHCFRVSRKWDMVYTPHARYVHKVAPGGQGRGFRRLKRNLADYRRFFVKNFPQTPKYRMAYYWSVIGWSIRAVVLALLRPIVRGYVST